MKYTVDVERRFSDIKTYTVEAGSEKEAGERVVKAAMQDSWPWPEDPQYSIMYSEPGEEP